MKSWLARLLMLLSFWLQRRARALSPPTWLSAARPVQPPLPVEAMRTVTDATLAAARSLAAEQAHSRIWWQGLSAPERVRCYHCNPVTGVSGFKCRSRIYFQTKALNAAQTNRVLCGAQRADGAPCTLEREHLGQPHSYCGVPFERDT